jgi:hypothetical protein
MELTPDLKLSRLGKDPSEGPIPVNSPSAVANAEGTEAELEATIDALTNFYYVGLNAASLARKFGQVFSSALTESVGLAATWGSDTRQVRELLAKLQPADGELLEGPIPHSRLLQASALLEKLYSMAGCTSWADLSKPWGKRKRGAASSQGRTFDAELALKFLLVTSCARICKQERVDVPEGVELEVAESKSKSASAFAFRQCAEGGSSASLLFETGGVCYVANIKLCKAPAKV